MMQQRQISDWGSAAGEVCDGHELSQPCYVQPTSASGQIPKPTWPSRQLTDIGLSANCGAYFLLETGLKPFVHLQNLNIERKML